MRTAPADASASQEFTRFVAERAKHLGVTLDVEEFEQAIEVLKKHPDRVIHLNWIPVSVCREGARIRAFVDLGAFDPEKRIFG